LIEVWLLDLAGLLTTLSFLAYGSWRDILTREVSNRLWLVSYPVGLVLLGTRLSVQSGSWSVIAVSIMITTVLSLALALLGLWGGADAKGFICLAINNPTVPTIGGVVFSSVDPFFPLIVFANSYIASLASLVYVVQRNLRAAGGNGLFDGFERESTTSKVTAFLTGYRATVDELRSSLFLFPIEYTESEGLNSRRRFRFEPRLDDNREKELVETRSATDANHESEYVWVSPGLPFLVFVTAGLALSVTFGDIVWHVVSSVMSSLSSIL